MQGRQRHLYFTHLPEDCRSRMIVCGELNKQSTGYLKNVIEANFFVALEVQSSKYYL